MLKNTFKLGSFLLLLVMLFSACSTVDEGTRGIQITLGAADEKPLDPGAYFVWVGFQTIEEIDVRQHVYELGMSAGSADEQQVHTKVAVNYRLRPEQAVACYSELGLEPPTWETVVFAPAMQRVIKAVTAKYKVSQLITKRDEVSGVVASLLKEEVGSAASYFDILEVSITDFQPSATYQKAIEAKQVAMQAAQQAQNELDRNELDVQKLEQKADAEARAQVTRAKARAEAIRIESEAEAAAHDRLSRSATKLSLRQLEIKKWDGRTPLYIGGSSATVMLPTQTAD